MITKSIKIKGGRLWALGMLCALCASCSDFFDQQSEHVIFTDVNHLDNATDTIYSVTGILDKLQAIADRTIVLGEVRGDLVDVTSTSTSDLRDVALFNIGDDNRYNQPRDYYAVINNCNYFIAHADTALKNNRNEYIFMREYVAVKAIRAWTYLQLVLNYGNVPFVTEPILNKIDTEKDYPKYNLQAVCEYFINDLAPLAERWGNQYPGYGTIRGLSSRLLFFPVNIVLGDLNLWLASATGDQAKYRQAAIRYYKYINERNGENSSYPVGLNIYTWKPGSTTWNNTVGWTSGTLEPGAYNDNAEVITVIAGDSIPAEGNYSELRNLFYAREDNNYHVSLVPSTGMFNLSESQKHCCIGSTGTTVSYAPSGLSNHLSGDLRLYRYYDEGYTYDRNTGERIEVSYISKQNTQHVRIYRRSMLYLRLAEALNGAGFPRAAFEILSQGLNNDVMATKVFPYCSEADSLWIKQIDFPSRLYGIFTVEELAYDRTTANHNTIGIHSHGSGWTPMNEYYRLPEDSLMTEAELNPIQKAFVDSLLLDECALELAFEGTRYYDIMRFAMKQSNPGQFLQRQVCSRHGKDNIDAMRGEIGKDLSDPRNWYLQWNGQIGQ